MKMQDHLDYWKEDRAKRNVDSENADKFTCEWKYSSNVTNAFRSHTQLVSSVSFPFASSLITIRFYAQAFSYYRGGGYTSISENQAIQTENSLFPNSRWSVSLFWILFT